LGRENILRRKKERERGRAKLWSWFSAGGRGEGIVTVWVGENLWGT